MRPRDPVELLVARTCAEILGRPWVGVRDALSSLGADAAARHRLAEQVARAAGAPGARVDLVAADTVEGIAGVLKRSSEAARVLARGFWARNVDDPPGTGRTPLFFFHGERTGGLPWLNTAGRLGADQPVYGIAPHVTAGEPIPETVEAIAADHLRMVRAIQPAGPYLLGGHCNGAVAAFEAARQLVSQGEHVIGVLLVAPMLPSTYRRGLIGLMTRFILPVLDGAWVRCRPLALRLRQAVWRGRPLPRGLAGRPVERWSGELFERYSAVLQTYCPPVTSLPAVIFWPRHEPWRYRVPSSRAWRRALPRAGWVELPGTHIGCATDHSAETAAAMRRAIDDVVGQSGPVGPKAHEGPRGPGAS
ncbi:MAG TPA: thioesterase domain-containing protein [Candidatus Deferrimicrobiaceae bacterium]|nr:thioesterase domain-containing protein [Candidatus Deferrimicrobiaceae bacterium]